MKRIFAIFFIFIFLGIALPVQAQQGSGFSSAVPAILPNNPFYFLKSWGKSMQLLFAESRTERTITELNRLGERAEEIRLMIRYEQTSRLDLALLHYARQANTLSSGIQTLESADLSRAHGFRSHEAFLSYILTHLVKHIDFSQKILSQELEEGTTLALSQGRQALIEAMGHVSSNLDSEDTFLERLSYIVVVEESTFARGLLQQLQSQ